MDAAIWVAIVSGIALLASNSFQNAAARRREDRMRDAEDGRAAAQRRADLDEKLAERQHDLQLRKLARQSELADFWRDSRFEAHQELLAAAERTVRAATQSRWAGRASTDLDECRATLDRALARVELIGGPASTEEARAVATAVDAHLGHTLWGFPTAEGPGSVKAINREVELRSQAYEALEAYREAVRHEIGASQ